MRDSRTFVVLGAGHAGGRAVQAMRRAGFEGRIVLIGDEPFLPYVRPPLSKELLIGDDGIEKVQLNRLSFYEEQRIELRLGTRGEVVDCKSRTVRCGDGTVVEYDRLLFTTGARVRKLPVANANLSGVHYLRNYQDSQAIREALGKAARVVVIGGGFIGLEVAASARSRGCRVVVIEMTDRFMGRSVAPEIGEWFSELHGRHGVDVYLGASVAAIAGDGKVERVLLCDQREIPADVVVIGVGIVPNTELAEAAGIEVDDGIVVDEYGRASEPDVFAAGDVTKQPNVFLHRRVRLESYQNAQDQAMTIGRNICAPDDAMQPYCDRLWLWTDQYDVNLQILGRPDHWDRLVYRGDIESGRFTVFYMDDDRIVGVNMINNGRELRLCEQLMHMGAKIDDTQLANPDVRLRSLIG